MARRQNGTDTRQANPSRQNRQGVRREVPWSTGLRLWVRASIATSIVSYARARKPEPAAAVAAANTPVSTPLRLRLLFAPLFAHPMARSSGRHRHNDAIRALQAMQGYEGERDQGFVTSTNRFVNRKEAYRIHFPDYTEPAELHSDDLY
jgi:hypothetical protein